MTCTQALSMRLNINKIKVLLEQQNNIVSKYGIKWYHYIVLEMS